MALNRGYLVVIDAEGGEVPGSRRPSTGSYQRDLRQREALEAGMGEGCSVIFRDGSK
ncbi:MAG: hypothetical protein GW855_07700 [Erythrobacter sp.]|nr:hypothetical protein [Erythrobacter sp.]NCQ62421.1 hypothetical protein [Alphaproteobacteria bacterium]